MKKILITGGPVHAHLDSVKIITNRFKGGLMAVLVEDLLEENVEVHYISSKAAVIPRGLPWNNGHEHLGFNDYKKKVLNMAPAFDAVVLGAAVCNLIPVKQIKGKFPSHNYKPGDIIPIDFTIAPRIIDEVKRVAPNTHLFGYKLLAGVPHEELIQAAYDIVLESRATCVFANDASNLERKFAVTKEGSEHEISYRDVSKFIMKIVNDKYYKTDLLSGHVQYDSMLDDKTQEMISLVDRFKEKFVEKNGYIFGTVALRVRTSDPDSITFVTTARGKNEIKDFTVVSRVDHDERIVNANKKRATLNAPLLARIFELNPKVNVIVHYHDIKTGLKVLPYAPPGTERDSLRPDEDLMSDFEIENHGVFRLFEDI